ncbi:hypothetical protein [Ostreibacterium oceani]|uniref:Uncharacterized protein n=1 Tax=Ostreibacterium oceani TaxID=2654998 RepID=A0A6N7EVK6_9GAMM|nr:hypothetical protein [Ostreibacterium oceani]MPV86794.1 hypothetical protein [Ostreibacterium oceani]
MIELMVFLAAQTLLGSALVLACLKRRYGYVFFALGLGVLLGIVANLGLISFYQTIRSDWQWAEIAGLNVLLALPILWFFRAKNCTLEELRLEKAPSNLSRFIFTLLLGYLLIRLGLSVFDYGREITALTDLSPHLSPHLGSIRLFDHPSNVKGDAPFYVTEMGKMFLDLYTQSIQRAGMAPLQTSVNSLLLYWFMMMVGMGLMVYGGLRYLGAPPLLALTAIYLLVSLPVLTPMLMTISPSISLSSEKIHAQIGGYGAIAMMVQVALTIGVAIFLTYRERRFMMLVVVLLLLGLAYLHATLFWVPVIAMIFFALLGNLGGSVATTVLLILLYALGIVTQTTGAMIGDFMALDTGWNSGWNPSSLSHDLRALANVLWHSQWGWLLLAVGVTLLFLPRAKNQLAYQGLWLLSVAGAVAWIVIVVMASLTTPSLLSQSSALSVWSIIQLPAQFAVLLGLLPVCLYLILDRDPHSLA